MHRHAVLDQDRLAEVLVVGPGGDVLDRCPGARDHGLGRRPVDCDVDRAEHAGLFQQRGEVVRVDREDGRHRALGPLGVEPAPDVHEPDRVCEVERADVDEVVVLAEAEPERQLGVDPLRLERLQVDVTREEHPELDVAVRREEVAGISEEVGTQIAAEHVARLVEDVRGDPGRHRECPLDHRGVARALPRKHEDLPHVAGQLCTGLGGSFLT